MGGERPQTQIIMAKLVTADKRLKQAGLSVYEVLFSSQGRI